MELTKFNRFSYKPRDITYIAPVAQARNEWILADHVGASHWDFHPITRLVPTDVICIRYTDGATEYRRGIVN